VTDDRERIAVVTGGGSGIGAAAARELAADGWTVVIAGRRREALDAVAGGAIHAQPADVTDPASVRELFHRTAEQFGRVDLLFNNAGVNAPGVDIDELDVDDWNRAVAVNLTGVFLCTREAFRVMRRQTPQGGRIINNGSLAAHTPRPHSIAYTATKHAVSGLTKSTALDGRPYGISCGQIDIGNASTDMAAGSAVGALQPNGEVTPEPLMDVAEAARAVRYMASLPPGANVLTMTVMATTMPYVGRG
jgi:NAD(P)-dependent dehydrogenase (short-subunit alcohol dehydrogenase family)